jgi:hypothetical protein
MPYEATIIETTTSVSLPIESMLVRLNPQSLKLGTDNPTRESLLEPVA